MTALLLASASKARKELLTGAGLSFEVHPASIDEAQLIAGLQNKVPVAEIAQELAARKALAIAAAHSDALVIGADQILTCHGRLYQKPATRVEAQAHLESLQGREHQLVSTVCVAQGDNVVWQHVDVAALAMRALDGRTIGRYLDAVGDTALHTVGAYELEGQGAWLFERVEGDYFTILGLPLLPLLGFLRTQGFGP